jgi:hypothetical protein
LAVGLLRLFHIISNISKTGDLLDRTITGELNVQIVEMKATIPLVAHLKVNVAIVF